MYNAYSLKTLGNLPVKIASIEAYDDILFIGTKQGHLFMYRVADGDDLQLLRYKKYLCKKSITGLNAVKDYNILLAQSDGSLTLYDIDLSLTNFPVIADLKENTRTPSLWSGHYLHSNSNGSNSHKLREEMNLPDVPKAMSWCGDTLVLAFRFGEPYQFVKISDHESKLIPTQILTSTQLDPLIFVIKDQSKFALVQDEHTHFLNFDGTTCPDTLTWLKTPFDMVYDSPFYIATNSDCLDIMTEAPSLLGAYIWHLIHIFGYFQCFPSPLKSLLCLKRNTFELAICLCNNLDDPTDESKTIQLVKTLYGLDLLVQKNLFPGILPPTLRVQFILPEEITSMEESDILSGLPAFKDYLLNFRNKMIALTSKKLLLNLHPLIEGIPVLKSKKKIMMIIDTSLLMCYLKKQEALVNSLLRLKDNNCHIEETEIALTKAKKYESLIIFYNSKGLHRKSLELLKTLVASEDSNLLKNIQDIVIYLQGLGSAYLELIFEFAEDIIRSNPDEGIDIFIEDVCEVENLPRREVYDFLVQLNSKCAIKYLEHIIKAWKETSIYFHNQLVSQYTKLLQDPNFSEYYNELKTNLYEHLKTSQHYEPKDLIFQFPKHSLHEERAILLGRNGQHKDALFTYLYVLKDLPKALLYCSDMKNNSTYSHLIHLLLNPPEKQSPILDETNVSPFEYELSDILSILQTYVKQIDVKIIIQNLPDQVPLASIKKNLQIGKGLTHSEFLRVQRKRVLCESYKIEMSDLHICSICKKRFNAGNTFVRVPEDLSIVHYSCQEKKKQYSQDSVFSSHPSKHTYVELSHISCFY
ncbi:VPS39 [Lepeophtheirus salmonis]|uniref:VPS39 n=1 Tax=Lepeophtheirus salmonis TaxID=72036 RepID=A0A7R8CDJ1_LEPSM|nr:VPS39 [Lepeophtheirus salmonis]CAF2749865.1 VPS39 [Lepeophtheirus salmonis]